MKKWVVSHGGALQGGPLSVVEAASSHCHRRPDNGTSDWPRDGESGLMLDRDAKLGAATGHRLGISKRFGGIPEGILYGLYESPAWTHSPIGSWSADPH